MSTDADKGENYEQLDIPERNTNRQNENQACDKSTRKIACPVWAIVLVAVINTLFPLVTLGITAAICWKVMQQTPEGIIIIFYYNYFIKMLPSYVMLHHVHATIFELFCYVVYQWLQNVLW